MSSKSWTDRFVNESLTGPNITGLEVAPFEDFGDTFDVLNDGSGANFRTASKTVYLDINAGNIIFTETAFYYENIKVWGTLIVECPYDILRYKLSSETPPEEVSKWVKWAGDKGVELDEEDIKELLEY